MARTTSRTRSLDPALTQAISYCEVRRAFFIVDTPSDVNNFLEFKTWLTSTLDAVRHKNAAVYFPRTVTGDPLDEFRLRTFGASGTIAGLYSRIDSARGVWKAPAGTEAGLRNVQKFDYKLNDAENGVLNPLGINCLRTFDVAPDAGRPPSRSCRRASGSRWRARGRRRAAGARPPPCPRRRARPG